MKRIWKSFTPYQRIAIIILIPIIILSVGIAVNIKIFHSSYNELIKENISFRLGNTFTQNEVIIQNIIKSVDMLGDRQSVVGFLQNQTTLENREQLNAAMDAMDTACNRYEYIDSIAIINRDNKYVISQFGVYNFDEYFDRVYHYDNYNVSFWKSFRLYGLATYQRQPPSAVSENGSIKYIIPVIFCQIGNIKMSNYIVVNLSIEAMLKNANKNAESMGANICIMNKITGQVFELKNGIKQSNIFGSDMYKRIVENEYNSFDCKNNGRKEFVVSHTPSNSLLEYCYYACISYSNMKTKRIIFFITFLNFLIAIAAFFAVVLSIKHITKPLKELVAIFKNSDKENNKYHIEKHNVFQYLQDVGREMINENSELHNERSSFIQEKYLTAIISGNKYYREKEIRGDLNCPEECFKYSFFSAIIIRLRVIGEMCDIFDENSMYAGFFEIVRARFETNFETFVLPLRKDSVCVILNPCESSFTGMITQTVSGIKELLEFDRNIIEFSVGCSDIYYGVDNIKAAYEEANESLTVILGKKINAVMGINYYYKRNDEQSFYNLLRLNEVGEAKKLIISIFDYNVEIGVSQQTVKLLYIQILQTVFRIINEKELPVYVDIDAVLNISDISAENMRNEILRQLTMINDCINQNKASDKINLIVKYINDNYEKDLSLEILADMFGDKPKNISRIFKERIGVGFFEYLAEMRINKSKKLLINTTGTLQNIYTQVGFNNKTTFIRTFKKFVGMTPMEYRNTIKNNH